MKLRHQAATETVNTDEAPVHISVGLADADAGSEIVS